MENESLTFASWLQAELDRRDMIQADLARAIGVSTSLVSYWLSGQRRPNPRSCRRIAAALGLPDQTVLFRAGHIAQLHEPESVTIIGHEVRRMQQELERLLREVRRGRDVAVRVIGRVPADSIRFSALEEGEAVRPVDVAASDLQGVRSPFGLEISGDCMRSVGIFPGDVVICDRPDGRRPADGQLVVVRINHDEITLKRWCPVDRDRVELRDGDGRVMYTVTVMDDVEIIGLYVTYKPGPR